jgi:hypothetical protein
VPEASQHLLALGHGLLQAHLHRGVLVEGLVCVGAARRGAMQCGAMGHGHVQVNAIKNQAIRQ